MRLSLCRNRSIQAAVLAAWVIAIRLSEASLHRSIQAGPS